MLIESFTTFTVPIDVYAWMRSTSEMSGLILLTYMEDLASTLYLKGTATSCLLNDGSIIWFTFSYSVDKNNFMSLLAQLWNEGWWLNDD